MGFNHFNVSLTDPTVRPYLLAYERDAIRPHVLGDFAELLAATARHPAMLHYLDNARSVAADGAPTTFDGSRYEKRSGRAGGRFGRSSRGGRGGFPDIARSDRERALLDERRPQGLNENYARELMELHTLGVDGGYTQDDVREVARAFTGWSVLPPPPLSDRVAGRLALVRSLGPRTGFVQQGDFIFRADSHDAGRKEVLGHRLPAGRGIEDGEEVLEILASHRATAQRLAAKLATRFVADQPPAALVDRLATTFRRSEGDLAAVMRDLVYAPELWQAAGRRQKIKSPFELAVSAVRALGAEVDEPAALLAWVSRMGQPLYRYQAPTGYPDSAEAWVNTGALLSRMSFGLELASGGVDGVELDLAALAGHREPASTLAALEIYAALLLPEQDLAETLELLEAVVGAPELSERLAGRDVEPPSIPSMMTDERLGPWEDPFPGYRPRRWRRLDESAVAQVAGVLLGSPEFQRR